MYQALCHDLAATITEMSRRAAENSTHENAVYQKVLQQRDNAARVLEEQLPDELRAAWSQYQTYAERSRFMEQEVQFLKGCCSYPLIMEYFRMDSMPHQNLLCEILNKFR